MSLCAIFFCVDTHKRVRLHIAVTDMRWKQEKQNSETCSVSLSRTCGASKKTNKHSQILAAVKGHAHAWAKESDMNGNILNSATGRLSPDIRHPLQNKTNSAKNTQPKAGARPYVADQKAHQRRVLLTVVSQDQTSFSVGRSWRTS